MRQASTRSEPSKRPPAARQPSPGSCAVERRLHRARRDAVGVDDPLLDREHDQDRSEDRDEPVDRDPQDRRQAFGEAVDRGSSPYVLPPPALDTGMVAGQENVGDTPASELVRPRVVRILEPTVETPRRTTPPRPSPPRAHREGGARSHRGRPWPGDRRWRRRTARSRSRRCRDARRCARRSPRSGRRGASAALPARAPRRPPG